MSTIGRRCSQRSEWPLVILAVATLLAFTGRGHAGVGFDGIDYPVPFSLEDVEIHDSGGYDIVGYEGADPDWSFDRIGHPQLPVLAIRFILPPETRIEDVRVTVMQADTLPGTYLPIPIQPESWEDDEFVPPDPLIYESWEPYPRNPIRVAADGRLRTFHLATLVVYPLQYIGATQKLLLLERVRVEADLRTMTDAEMGQVHKRFRQDLRPLSQRSDIRWILQMVRNPQDFDIFYRPNLPDGLHQFSGFEKNPFGGFRPTRFPSLEGPPVECVIITDSVDVAGASIGADMITEFQRLADWKTRKGVPCVIRTVEWIADNYSGADRPEKIRNFVVDASTYWGTNYILLGGDVDIVPSRFLGGPGSNLSNGLLKRADPPADIYYGELDQSWNEDPDAYYGETIDDWVHPRWEFMDLWVGRIPARDAAEAGTIIDKVLTYERSPDAPAASPPDTSYYNDVLLVAGPTNCADGTGANPVVFAEETLVSNLQISLFHTDIKRLYCFPPDYETYCGAGGPLTRCYQGFYEYFEEVEECWPSGGPACSHFTAENFRMELAEGYGFVYHMEHSWRDKLGDITPLEDKWTGCDSVSWRNECLDSLKAANPGWQGDLHWDMVDHLQNGPEYSIVVSGGSYTNQWDLDAVGEHFVRAPSGGAVAYFGKAASHGDSNVPVREFLLNVFNRGLFHLGEATGQATNSTFAPLAYGINWSLLGDPEMPLWTKAPDEMGVTITPRMLTDLGAQTITVEARDKGTLEAIEGARVCLKQQDLAYAVQWTGNDGVATFPSFTPLDKSKISVIVTARNYLPEEGGIKFMPLAPAPAYVAYSYHYQVDSGEGGDGDGVLEAGETVYLWVAAENMGDLPANGAWAYLWPTAPITFRLTSGALEPEYRPEDIYIGALNAHPHAAAVGDTFRIPANWEAIRPEGEPSPGVLEKNSFCVWRDTMATWHVRGDFVAGEADTLWGHLATEGGFSEVEVDGLEPEDAWELISPDTLSFKFTPDGDPDLISFGAESSDWLEESPDSIYLGDLDGGEIEFAIFTVTWIDADLGQSWDEAVFTVAVRNANRTWWYSDFDETVHAPRVDLMVQHVETGQQGSDGVVEIWPILCNQGSAVADSCCVVLCPTNPTQFDEIDALACFGALAPGDTTVAGDSLYLRKEGQDWIEDLQYTLDIRTYHPNGDSTSRCHSQVEIVAPVVNGLDGFCVDEAGGATVLRWEPVEGIPDLAGYHVFGYIPGDTTRLTRAPIVGVTRYEATGLAPLDDWGDYITYRFAVTAVDSSGNESAKVLSDTAYVWLPEVEGWPRRIPTGSECAPKVYDVDGDGDLEIFAAGKDIYAWHHDGTPLIPENENGLFYDTGTTMASEHAIQNPPPPILAASKPTHRGLIFAHPRSAASYQLPIVQVHASRAVRGLLRPHFARGRYARTRSLIFLSVPVAGHQLGEPRARIPKRSRASNNTRLEGCRPLRWIHQYRAWRTTRAGMWMIA